MMKPIIKIENLSKRYQLGTRRTSYATLRETISQKVFSRQAAGEKWFWALQNVDFAVERGEVVGIIGRNGAGKSTLLKILSRVTEPTTGRIELYGRTNSLLEVGTGFHPELTGRENIFVNGAILGLRHSEIKRLFDEIVAFAEIEKFLDTPVKFYSSGMYMRLAFSVAAHLEPDILVIDEVLSVGDAQFQKKCLGKVQDVASHGRTVLFVSHNMAAVENLCSRGVVLETGKVIFQGNQTDSIARYLESVSKNIGEPMRERADRIGSGEITVTALEFRDANGKPIEQAISGQEIEVCLHFETAANAKLSQVNASFMVRTNLDSPVFLQHNRLTGDDFGVLPPRGIFVCRIPKLPLPPASYRLGFSLMLGEEYLDRIDDACELTVVDGDFFGSGEVPPATHGCCLVEAGWRLDL
jgi:lipopolysaccharide transport system ATP-binding protein